MTGVSSDGGRAPADRVGQDAALHEDPDDRDDRALLAAHLDGDPEAFGTLFRRHRDRLWAVALRTVADREEAADALQDAMVSAFRRADAYRGDAAVTTWLHRIVVNACLDRIRRRTVRAADPLPDDLDEYAGRATLATSTAQGASLSGSAGDPTGDPAQAVLDGERRVQVFEALDALPPEQRAALVLVDMQGYSVHEAAEVLGCAVGTVKSRCSRGRSRLAPLLAPLLATAPALSRPSSPPASGRASDPASAAPRPSASPREPDGSPRRPRTRTSSDAAAPGSAAGHAPGSAPGSVPGADGRGAEQATPRPSGPSGGGDQV